MIARLIIPLILLGLALPAAAERRGYTVTSFERIVVNGPFIVRVTTGRGSSAHVEGDSAAIDQISIQQTGRTLTVRRNVSGNWGGYPGESRGGAAIVEISTPLLDQATVIGTGDLAIDRMAGGRVIVSLGGNGRLAVGAIETDNLSLSITGAGGMEIGGHAETGRITVQGAGTIEAPGLNIENLHVNLNGPGVIRVASERSADITAVGTGSVEILGDASCIDRSLGAAEVRCGGLSGARF